MAQKLFNTIITHSWLRIGLAVGLLVAGLAPIGVPIVSDNSWRQVENMPGIAAVQPAQPFVYRTSDSADGSTRVQRSDDGGLGWHEVAAIPAEVREIVAVAGNEEVAYARTQTAVWVTVDAGATWSQTSILPSRPAAVAVTSAKPETVYVGTESGGLFRSNNSGDSWQSFQNAAFPAAGAAPVGVTALAVNPEDNQIVYAAVGFWLGTTHVRFDPLGVYASTDGGSNWFQMSRAALGSPTVEKIEPTAVKPLSVVAVDALGQHRIEMELNDGLIAALDDANPSARAAAARTIGLLGDRSALPLLLNHLQAESDILAGEQIGWAIGQLGDPTAVQPLLAALESDNEALQSRSAYALGLLRADEAVPALAQTLETGGAMAQRRAAEALGAIGTSEAVAALQEPLSDSEMSSARNAAMMGLEIAGSRAVDGLTGALQSQNVALRSNAAEMLGWLKAGEATPALSRALSDADPAVRQQVAWALGEIDSPEAQQALASALRFETDSGVRQTSQAALASGEATPQLASATGPEWATGLLGVLATIPVGKWAFMTLATAAAVLLLLAGSRSGHRQPQAI